MPNVTLAQALQIALAHQQAGRLREAESLCLEILRHVPDEPSALCLLGLARHQSGRSADALDPVRRAAALAPSVPEFPFHLGNVLAALGRRDEAVAAYRAALERRPGYTDALNNLGIALVELGRPAEAADAFAELVRLSPNDPSAHTNLANALADQERLDEAVAAYRRALQLHPSYARAHRNLGNTLLRLGRLDEAAAACHEAIRLQTNYARAHSTLGLVLLRRGRPADAAACWQTALRHDPRDAESYSNLGIVLRDLARFDEAVVCCRQAIELRPNFPEAFNNLGNALSELGRITEASAAYEQALALRPGFTEARNNLGTVYEKQGRLDDAIACYRAALAARPDYRAAHDNLVIALHYHGREAPEAVFAEARRWAERHAPATGPEPTFDHDRNLDRILRIGYVSPDLKQHPIPFFFEPILAAHDRARFHVTCYVDAVRPDAVTERLRGLADVWRDVTGRTDDEVADLVRRERIDLLVDLAVHAPQNRLPMFALRPAPVQISYLGYAGTTGVPAIRYRITDAIIDPSGATEALNTEELIRLEPCFCAYRPPREAPPVAPLPARTAGVITFASLNRLAKITPEVRELWARLLRAVPGSRLLLQASGLSDPGVQELIAADFARHGVTRDRLVLKGWGSFHDYLAHFHAVDIGLDTFPFNGHTTTCHTLWMGVPVIVLEGRTSVARVGVSLMRALGLGDMIAGTPDEFVAIGSRLAHDLAYLQQLREGMRARMAASPLLDETGLTRRLESAYRELWRRWCGSA